MKRPGASLKAKIMAGVAGLVLAFGAAVMGYIDYGLARMLTEELTRRGVTIAHVLAKPAEELLLTDDQFALLRLLQATMRSYDDVRYIYVLGGSGQVRAHTFEAGMPKGLAQLNASAAAGGPRTRRVRTEEGVVQDIALPLLDGRLGSVHVGMSERTVRRRVTDVALGWSATAAVLLAIGLCLAYWLTSRLADRLARLVEAARRVGEGDLEVRVEDEHGDEAGKLARALNQMVADLKRSQRHLLRSGKLAAIGELASSVAHEINNPLNTMGVCVQALQDRAESPALAGRPDFEDFPEYLKTINDEIFRCKGITRSLLDFARPKEPRREPADLQELVVESLPLVAHRARQAGVTLEAAPSSEPAVAEVDSDQIKQVLVNLLLNAIDHTRAGGRVLVRAERLALEARLSVEDSGCGIPPENLARVFEPFFTTKASGAGTGLGLAICQKIAETHHGRLEVDSAVGRGSTFTLRLPLDSREALPLA